MKRINMPDGAAERALESMRADRQAFAERAGLDPQAFFFDDLIDKHQIGEADDEGTVEVILYGSIGGYFGIDAWAFAKDLKKTEANKLVVRLDSGGGSIFDGVVMYNALVDHSADVEIVVDSVAASMASVLLQAADSRVMNRGSKLMIHNPWGAWAGTADDFRDMGEFLDELRATIVDIYSARSDTGRDVWDEQLTDKDFWISAERSVELGLADEVVAMKAPNDAKNDSEPDAQASGSRKIDATSQVADETTSKDAPDSDEAAATAAADLERQRAEQVATEALAVSARVRALNPA